MPGDMLSVRAVVDSKEKCPSACIDGKKVEMTERALEEGENFPEKVYELLIPRNIQDIKINGKKIPTLPSKINKIVMIGDTGCRVSCSEQQTCNNQVEWPIKEVLSSVAKHNPDLIIHVGDYHYRECACKDEEKCGKSVR
ncbi:hypothetical protein [Wolbachia endosymbiont of Ctenocephalides felis wCfeT]|uniref:hypothetical protein n=1 Tax=Wolbachia endosymbiont of Ctenocephalides felis wCfeT TaxID=2732593 RepID=UPI001447B942|nr:hypothetical protein [Wolbachia endosymbiont of Ctenocephalides felis wCfeT]